MAARAQAKLDGAVGAVLAAGTAAQPVAQAGDGEGEKAAKPVFQLSVGAAGDGTGMQV